MKNLLKVLAAMALVVGAVSAHAETIERDSDGDLTINVFANIQESFRVTISNADMLAAGSPSADGILDLNGGLSGFDALKSLADNLCEDSTQAAPTYAGATSCSVNNQGSASNSSLQFSVDLDVAVEISGPGSIDLSAAMSGVTNGDEVFANSALSFASNSSTSVTGLGDQATDTLTWTGDAALNGGPSYDDTIVVTVTKM